VFSVAQDLEELDADGVRQRLEELGLEAVELGRHGIANILRY
jgi:hypothetical protein